MHLAYDIQLQFLCSENVNDKVFHQKGLVTMFIVTLFIQNQSSLDVKKLSANKIEIQIAIKNI